MKYSANRILGVDAEGVLYIGETRGGVYNRIGDIIKSLRPTPTFPHDAGEKYNSNSKFKERFPYDRLCLTFQPAEDPKKAEGVEINNYFQKFGEIPPFNRQG